MGDLKTPFEKAVFTDFGMAGELPTSRGTDPLTDLNAAGATSALKPLWSADKMAVSTFSGEETPNSITGLPLQPNRFQPSEEPPQPPTLQDHNPGTIDKR